MSVPGALTNVDHAEPKRGSGKLRRFFRHPTGVLGLAMVVFLVLVSLLAPVLKPYDPGSDRDLRARLAPPSAEHLFGADALGRDIFTRVLHGGRISLQSGLLAVAFASLLGTLLGVLAGFVGGRVDVVIMWTVDLLLAFPGILLAIAIVATLGPNLTNALLAIAVTQVPIFTRIMRSAVMQVKEAEYVQAARAVGSRATRVVLKHVLPNSLAPLIVQLTLSIGTAILDVAALGFLGLGAQPPTPEWGLMIRDGFSQFLRAPWMSIFPGLGIFLAVVGFNLLGDAIRDVLDPRLRGV